MPFTLTDAILILIVTLAFTTEAAIGFGATLLTLALGSLVAKVDELIYAVVPLNVALSFIMAIRSYKHIDVRALGSGILPAMAVGFPIGIVAFEKLPKQASQIGLGGLVTTLGALELFRQLRAPKEVRPLGRAPALALLFLGGLVHGAFATGGPPVVYVCGRTLLDKKVFRGTLAALWLLLGAILLAAYARAGHLGAASFRRSALLLPGLLLGLAAGEVAHGRLPERTFRLVVFVLLIVAGVVLVVRA